MSEFPTPTDDRFEEEEEQEYLNDLIDSYGELVKKIGSNGLSGALILPYRDEIEETVEMLRIENIPSETVVKLNWFDDELQERAVDFVAEVGRSSFIEGRKTLGSPKNSWWWYLDTQVKETKKVDLWKEFKKWLKQ